MISLTAGQDNMITQLQFDFIASVLVTINMHKKVK